MTKLLKDLCWAELASGQVPGPTSMAGRGGHNAFGFTRYRGSVTRYTNLCNALPSRPIKTALQRLRNALQSEPITARSL